MNVKELIEELENLNPEKTVYCNPKRLLMVTSIKRVDISTGNIVLILE